MNFETVVGISLLTFAVIVYAVSRLPEKTRFKYVDQRVKDRGETDYVIFLYI